MKRRKTLKKRYGAFGFAEALMAIMVTGIAATVLMTISASSLRQLMQVEDRDRMSQLARSGAVLAQQIADEDATRLDEEKIYPQLANGSCYILNGIEPVNSLNTANVSTREGRIAASFTSTNENAGFFRVMCMEGTEANGKRIVKIITGLVDKEGLVTNGTDTKDYEYISIIDL